MIVFRVDPAAFFIRRVAPAVAVTVPATVKLPLPIVRRSASAAVPIVPAFLIIRSSAIVNRPAELNVIFAVAPTAAVSDTPVVNTNLVALAVAENVPSAIA